LGQYFNSFFNVNLILDVKFTDIYCSILNAKSFSE